jgi:hypothetical protein
MYLFVYAQVREGMREEYGCRGNKEERGRERTRMRNVNRLDKSVRWKSETAQLDRASDQRIFAWRQCKYNHRSTSGTISALVAFNPAVPFNPIH